MSTKKIIILALVILLLVVGAYFLWQKRHNYFFQGELENLREDVEMKENASDLDNLVDPEYDSSDEDEINNEESDDEEELDEDSVSDEIIQESYQEILEDDCGNKCEDKKDTDDYQYCLEICGLRKVDEDTTDDCEKLSGLSRDACFKNKAIKDVNYKYCSEIEDDNIRESCKDRVLEEIID